MIPERLRAQLEEIAALGLDDVTAWAHVRLGTESARALLSALGDADTLRRVRELAADGIRPAVLRALLCAPATETLDLVQERTR